MVQGRTKEEHEATVAMAGAAEVHRGETTPNRELERVDGVRA